MNLARQANPVVLGLQRAIFVYGAGVHVIREHNVVTYEDAVLDSEARAKETVARAFAICTYLDVSLKIGE